MKEFGLTVGDWARFKKEELCSGFDDIRKWRQFYDWASQ